MSPPVSQSQSSSLTRFLRKSLISHETVLPPYIYGPFPSERLPIPKPEFETISTNIIIYNQLSPNGVHIPAPGYVDFRDAAQAHVGALDGKPDKKNRKRILLVSPHGLTIKRVLDIIKKNHPELERRFITGPVPEFPVDRLDVDFARVEEVTGMRKQDFHTLEEVCSCLMVHFLRKT
jgi:nucleoside-diphosphate-sugar epimerase